ncbi:MAG: hypothetical protein ACLTDV_03900 [Eubacterium sp.]
MEKTKEETWRFIYEDRTVNDISDFPGQNGRRSNAEDRSNARGILFITNTDRKLIGDVTDGDIRPLADQDRKSAGTDKPPYEP